MYVQYKSCLVGVLVESGHIFLTKNVEISYGAQLLIKFKKRQYFQSTSHVLSIYLFVGI